MSEARDGVDAILFDLDGVLVDSLHAWHAAVNDVRGELDLPEMTLDDVIAIFGQGVADDVTNLYPGHTVAEIRRRYDETLPRHIEAIRLGPGTLDVLGELRARGLRLAIVTNTQHTLAATVLRHTGLDACVDAVAAAGRGLREKPHPDMLHDALGRLGDPSRERVRMVGDTTYDAEASARAGIPFLHFDLRDGGTLRDRLAPWLDGPPHVETP